MARSEKTSLWAVKDCVCISCGMIPTWQQNLNIIVHWTIKRNVVSACTSTSHSQFPFSFCLNFCLSFTVKLVTQFSYKSTNKCWSQMLMSDVMSLILLIGRRPVPVWAKCFCTFSEDGWTMRFWANKNVAHKSLPRHRGQSEIVCKRIIVTPMAL